MARAAKSWKRNKRKQPERSPLKDNPLNNPGESLAQNIENYFYDQVLVWCLSAAFVLIYIALEWYYYLTNTPRQPLLLSIMSIPFIGYCSWRVWRGRRQMQRMRLGLDGEKAVGQYLERLRTDGYQVFHDIAGQDFNLDHVIIGPGGIFTIETKTYSKPKRGNPHISFDGQALTVGSYQPDRDPVTQAKAQAHWLKELLKESTGQTYNAKPVIVFPGWFVEPLSTQQKETLWILNPKALPAFLKHTPAQLSSEQIHLAAYHLSRHCRTS